MDNKFTKLLNKLKPTEAPSEYVSDKYDVNDMVNEVADASHALSTEDVEKILNAESSGGQFLQNPISSAKGNFQFIDKTRKETLEGLKNQGNDEIPSNPLRQDALLMKTLVNKGENALLNSQKGAKKPDLESLYLMHHYGIQGGLNTLNNPEDDLSKARFRNIRAQLAKKPLTDEKGKPAKNLLELLKDK